MSVNRDGPIQVLIVQGSPLFHTLLSGALSRYRDLRALPGVSTAAEARDCILSHHPDVILFDLALPEPDATELLRSLREHYPVPILTCSGSSRSDGSRALAAIAQGALDVVVKPAGLGTEPVRQLGEELAGKIRSAVTDARPVPISPRPRLVAGQLSFRAAGINPQRHLIVVGASTGGTEAIGELLANLPADSPGVAIVQHMPAMFTPSFAERLNAHSTLQVSEAVEGDLLRPGRAVVARGDTHLTVRRTPRGWTAHYTHQRPVNRHCPSVGELFDSAREALGSNAVGIILTGMGADGAQALLRLRRCGALTVAQDARTCVVHGMPKAAEQLAAVEFTAPPADIPRLVVRALAKRRSPAPNSPAPIG